MKGNAHNLLEKEVIPILDSIIEKENHALKNIQFPCKWGEYSPISCYLTQFMQRYSDTEKQQSMRCHKCDTNCREQLSLYLEYDRTYFGMRGISNTCYDCLEHYCYNCKDEDDRFFLSFCVKCKKFRCKQCFAMEPCWSCTQEVNNDANRLPIRNNIPSVCIDCIDRIDCHEYKQKCDDCGHVLCDRCDYNLWSCRTCNWSSCGSCRSVNHCARHVKHLKWSIAMSALTIYASRTDWISAKSIGTEVTRIAWC